MPESKVIILKSFYLKTFVFLIFYVSIAYILREKFDAPIDIHVLNLTFVFATMLPIFFAMFLKSIHSFIIAIVVYIFSLVGFFDLHNQSQVEGGASFLPTILFIVLFSTSLVSVATTSLISNLFKYISRKLRSGR